MLAEAHEAAHPVFGGVDCDRARAVLDGDAAEEMADESSHAGFVSARVGSVNMSADVEVGELGTARHLYEGCHELRVDWLVGCAVVDGERVALAVEGAGEGVVAAARHARDGDVGAEADGLTAEVAVGVLGQQVAEDVPAPGGVDGVLRACVVDGELGGVDADGGGDGAVVVVGHGELAAGQCEAGGGEAGYVTRIGGGVEGDSLVGGGVDDAVANPAHSAAEGDVAVSTADGEGYGAGFGLAANCLQGIVTPPTTTNPSAYADVVVIVGRGCRGASSACHLADVGPVILKSLTDTTIHQQAVGDGGVVIALAHQAAEVELISVAVAV